MTDAVETAAVHHHHHHHHVPAHVHEAIHTLFGVLKAHHPDIHAVGKLCEAHEAFRTAQTEHEAHLKTGELAAEAALSTFATRGV